MVADMGAEQGVRAGWPRSTSGRPPAGFRLAYLLTGDRALAATVRSLVARGLETLRRITR